MGSMNAFAREPLPHSSNSERHGQHIDRPPKRMRLSENTFAAIQTRCMHEDVALEVDHMILDYTAYQAIEACLASRNHKHQRASSTSLSASLSMANSFLQVFKARHPTHKADAELKFRIKLLKLITLFTRRLTSNPTTPSESSLDALRDSNKQRAQQWIQHTTSLPSSDFSVEIFEERFPVEAEYLQSNRAHILQELGIPVENEDDEDVFYGTASCVSLLDILPLFVEISASRNAMSDSNLSERWMHLASEFMLQACLEQYLVVGAEGLDAIDEAFAWGYDGNADDQTNEMFEDEEYAAEVEAWSDIKRSYLDRLLPGSNTLNESGLNSDENGTGCIVTHLETVASRFPIVAFESSIIAYLEALSQSVPEPVLVQLESGKLEGMTEEETQDFLAGCGVSVARLFEA